MVNDIFINTPKKFPRSTIYWFGFYILITIFFLITFLQNPSITNPGLIYVILSFINLAFILGAWVSKNQVLSCIVFDVHENSKKDIMSIGVGMVIGAFFISGLIGFSFAFPTSPYSIVSSNTLNNIILLIIIGFLGVEAEEMFRASTLLPSLLKFTGQFDIWIGIYSSIIIFSIISLFFLIQFIGYLALLLVIAVLVLDILIELYIKPRKGQLPNVILNHAFGIIFTSFVFMILHIYAYGQGSYTTNTMVYVFAFLFAMILDTINGLMQNTLSSRIAHSINNSTLTVIQLGLSWIFGVMIIVIYILFLITTGTVLGNKNFISAIRKEPAYKTLHGR